MLPQNLLRLWDGNASILDQNSWMQLPELISWLILFFFHVFFINLSDLKGYWHTNHYRTSSLLLSSVKEFDHVGQNKSRCSLAFEIWLVTAESKFLPLFVVLFHVTLIGAKIVITHITVSRIILKFFAAAWTSNWHIHYYYQYEYAIVT